MLSEARAIVIDNVGIEAKIMVVSPCSKCWDVVTFSGKVPSMLSLTSYLVSMRVAPTLLHSSTINWLYEYRWPKGGDGVLRTREDGLCLDVNGSVTWTSHKPKGVLARFLAAGFRLHEHV